MDKWAGGTARNRTSVESQCIHEAMVHILDCHGDTNHSYTPDRVMIQSQHLACSRGTSVSLRPAWAALLPAKF